MFGYTLIGHDGKFASKNVTNWVWGSVTVTALNWAFNSDTRSYSYVSASPVTGSGSFEAKQSMKGDISVDGRAATSWGPLTYSKANALAANQASLVGKWAEESTGFNVAIDVDAKGAFTGTTKGSNIGVCNISGAALHAEPQSQKNMYSFSMNAVNAAGGGEKACALDTTLPFAGPAAIVLRPAGHFVSNGYFRTLTLHAKTGNGALLTIYLRKQS
jgi:hypothetical protein